MTTSRLSGCDAGAGIAAAMASPLGGKLRLSINLTGRLQTFGRFVGNGLDRSVRLSR